MKTRHLATVRAALRSFIKAVSKSSALPHHGPFPLVYERAPSPDPIPSIRPGKTCKLRPPVRSSTSGNTDTKENSLRSKRSILSPGRNKHNEQNSVVIKSIGRADMAGVYSIEEHPRSVMASQAPFQYFPILVVNCNNLKPHTLPDTAFESRLVLVPFLSNLEEQ